MLRPHWAGQPRHAIATSIRRLIAVPCAVGRTFAGNKHSRAVTIHAEMRISSQVATVDVPSCERNRRTFRKNL